MNLLPTHIHLAPRGDFPHAHGLQRIDDGALNSLVREFGSWRARLARGWRGLPIFLGHPDAPDLAASYPDQTVYGRIVQLRAEPAGLFGEAEWTSEAQAKFQDLPYRYLSPYWEAEEIGVVNGRPVLQPARLISAGLTRHPNLPVQPMTSARFEQTSAIRRLLENALREGRLTPAQLPAWTHRLANDLAAGEIELSQLPAVMHTRSITADFGQRQIDLANQAARSKQLERLVQAHLRAGLSYDEAWNRVKLEHPALFAEMQHPGRSPSNPA